MKASFSVTWMTMTVILLGMMMDNVSGTEFLGGLLCLAVFIPALIANGGQLTVGSRRLSSIDPTIWKNAKETCSDKMYDMKLLVETKEGHLLLLATPAMVEDSVIVPDESDDNNDDNCGSYLIHTMKIGEDDSWKLTINIVDEKFMNTLSYEGLTFVSYDLEDGQRAFGDITSAIDIVAWDDNNGDTSDMYQKDDIIVPTNCGTFLLELSKYLEIPITEDMMSFVVTNVKNSNFMKRFTMDDIYQILAKESWFGGASNYFTNNLVSAAASTNRKLGTDPVNMLRRLGEFMVEQQYPKELITDN